MIITKLIGGLGNQMFQYAAGRQIAVANNTQLKLDITGYDHQVGITPREYGLGVFNIQAAPAGKSEIWRHRLTMAILRHHKIQQKDIHNIRQFLTLPDNSYLEGYWGSEKYFSDIEDIIRKDFTPKNKPDKATIELIQRIKNCNSVSVHVRRSDYVMDKKTHDFHGVCGLGYYKKSILLITKKVTNPSFFIFSDDPNWCKVNLRLQSSTIYVTHNLGNKDYEDVRLMSTCKHNIIANSSFSWWGAWLNKNKDKIVIAPKKWFREPSINTKDLIPQSWIKI